MKKFSIILLLFYSCSIQAQVKAITEKGDTILVFENGTWFDIKTEQPINPITSNVKVEVEVDEFSSDKKITTERWLKFGKDGNNYTIAGWVFSKSDVPVFYIRYSSELGCFSQLRSTMKVKLTNGEVIEFIQISDTECGENEIVGFIPCTHDDFKGGDYKNIVNQNLSILKSYDWETIRLQGTEFYTDIKPNTNYSMDKPEQFFRQHIIAIESK